MNLPERSGVQRRIGVAIQIPEPFGTELQSARAQCGDPLARAIPPHVTLLGPTLVDPGEIDAVVEHLTAVAARHTKFAMLLRGTGTFRPVSPVVFVQVALGIAECEQLEADVRSGPLAQELRFSYHPHVTVGHDVDEAALDSAFDDLAGYEAAFDAEHFFLYEHGDDGVWRPIGRFALADR